MKVLTQWQKLSLALLFMSVAGFLLSLCFLPKYVASRVYPQTEEAAFSKPEFDQIFASLLLGKIKPDSTGAAKLPSQFAAVTVTGKMYVTRRGNWLWHFFQSGEVEQQMSGLTFTAVDLLLPVICIKTNMR